MFAAASLTESFQAIASAFEHGHPGLTVRLSFGPSDGLATQIDAGAPADVFAPAAERWMNAVASERGVSDRAVLAVNRLVLIVPASNPARIVSLADVARRGVKLVLAAAGVPAGQYARQALTKAGVVSDAERNVVSNEDTVKGVVQKIVMNEADAGIVYETDLTPEVRKRTRAIDIPDSFNVRAIYPIGVVTGAKHPAEARAFVAYVLGPGERILRAAGFLAPS